MSNSTNKRFGVIRIEDLGYLLLIISPILSTYATPVQTISYGEIAICFSVLLLCKNRFDNNVYINNCIIEFLFYSIFITIFMSLAFSESVIAEVLKETIVIVVYFLILLFLIRRINVNRLFSIYIDVAKICALFLLAQYVIYVASGRMIPGIIPNVMTDAGVSSNQIIASMGRASSFFKEPAHYCQFLAIPLLVLIFRKNKSKRDNRTIVIFSISLLLTFSGNGFVILGIAIFSYWLKLMFSGEGSGFLKGILLFASISLVGLFVLSSTDLFDPIISRLFSGELTGNNSERVSGYVRIVRGYVVFNDFHFINKIFGVGFGNYEPYAVKYCYQALTSKTSYSFGYINGMQYYLVSTGLLGLFLYFRPMLKCLRFGNSFVRTLIIEFIAIGSIAGLTKGPIWLLILLTIYKSVENEEIYCEEF